MLVVHPEETFSLCFPSAFAHAATHYSTNFCTYLPANHRLEQVVVIIYSLEPYVVFQGPSFLVATGAEVPFVK